MSDDTPEIVLNEFGDLSRKARRELEAKGIDPDTAVLDFKIATGRIPIITEEEAAAAKNSSTQSSNLSENHASSTPESPHAVQQVAQSPESFDAQDMHTDSLPQAESVPVQTGFPRVENTVVSANTGPIEPIEVEPALDNSTLAAVEETLAAVEESTQPSFDDFFSPQEPESEALVVEKPEKISRKEKKALAKEAKKAKKAAETTVAKSADSVVISAEQPLSSQSVPVTSQEAPELRRRGHVSEASEEETINATASQEIDEDSYIFEVSEELTVIYEDESEAPQTISEATAAIAIAEAVAAAEATTQTNEIVVDFDTSSEVPTTTGSIPVISNALILPTLPETTGSISQVVPTGEVVITGSILIPPSVSQVGANVNNLDTSEVDILDGDKEVPNTSSHLAPVSAASAVSAYDIASSVITKPKGINEKLPFILSIAAAGLAVGVVALLVIGYISGIF